MNITNGPNVMYLDAIGAVANRMNNFQRQMSRWTALHPYNVVDIAELSGTFNAAALKTAAEQVLEEWGIGRLEWSLDSPLFTYRPGPANVSVRSLSMPTVSTARVLSQHATAEHNLPFEADGRFPIRMAGGNGPNSQFVTWTYMHWPLDGSAGKTLFLAIIRRYLNLPNAPEPLMRQRHLPPVARALRHHLGIGRRIALAGHTVRNLRALRYCHSPNSGPRTDLRVEVDFPNIPSDTLTHLRQLSRSLGATINDVLTAGLASAILEETPERRHEPRRKQLAIANIVNLRSLAPDELSRVTGLYLGYFDVFMRDENRETFNTLVDHIAQQTSRAKRNLNSLRALGELAYSNMIWPFMKPESRVRHFMNNHPVAAGISNLLLPAEHFEGGLDQHLKQIIRAVPTGMMTPLALGVTTAVDKMTITMTSRVTGYRAEVRQRIIARLENWLADLTSKRHRHAA